LINSAANPDSTVSADCRFDNTGAFSQRYTLEDMIALILEHLLNV